METGTKSRVHLEKVCAKNVWELLALEVDETQKSYVATNTESIVEAYTTLAAGGHVFPFGIYSGEKAVGFLMIGYGVDDDWTDAPEIARNSYSLWRLMIDRRYQKKGYGRQAIALALTFIRTFPCGAAKTCILSYEPENEVARRLYASFGFRETGDTDGDEVIAALQL